MKKNSALIFVTSLLSISSAFAFNNTNSFTVALGDAEMFFASKRNLENANVPFVAAGYNFTSNWGIEALLGRFSTHYSSDTEGHRVNGTLFSINGKYHFYPNNRVQPYATAGVGVLGLNHNGDDAHNAANINAGLGALLFFTPKVALRLEGRDLYTMASGRNDLLASAAMQFYFNLC